MLTLNQIETQFPKQLHGFKRFMLREYLQYKILQIIYEGSQATSLSFLGGTCLRILYGNERFSEDIDFDNFNITEQEFSQVSSEIRIQLEKEGYEVELKNVFKGAYHCYINIPELLHREGLSGYKKEKILIQLDTEPQHFEYKPQPFLLNRFDIFTQIFATPPDILLAQKFYAIINRKRNKGRDFFDAVFLLSFTEKPNYDFLDLKLKINSPAALKQRILERCNSIDMEEMAKDVQPFLFNSKDMAKVTLFSDYIKQVKL
jgi:predicted nucleotidyltransferase component of viral defense system